VAARDFRARLQKRASKAGLSIPDDLSSSIATYFDLLSRWNRKINLTALDDPDQAIDRLLLEPLVAARYLPNGPMHLMDIGSGGGSPAIPLKLVAPSTALTMVEAKARKSAFLREAVRMLALADVHVETSRYEELLARPELHERFDVLTVRAVRVEPRVLHTLQAFLRPSGSLFLFRGPSGPEMPSDIVPPLEFQATYPLVDAVQSRLTVLTKRIVGAIVNVPRGTLPAR
jgi:16S rRNA (guanine527-N7)-methyltransferase